MRIAGFNTNSVASSTSLSQILPDQNNNVFKNNFLYVQINIL